MPPLQCSFMQAGMQLCCLACIQLPGCCHLINSLKNLLMDLWPIIICLAKVRYASVTELHSSAITCCWTVRCCASLLQSKTLGGSCNFWLPPAWGACSGNWHQLGHIVFIGNFSYLFARLRCGPQLQDNRCVNTVQYDVTELTLQVIMSSKPIPGCQPGPLEYCGVIALVDVSLVHTRWTLT